MADADGGPSLTWRDIKARKKRTQSRVRISLDSEAADRLSEAEYELAQAEQRFAQADSDRARSAARQAVDDAEQAVGKARTLAADASVEFVVQALSRVEYDDLVSDHPVSDSQRNKAKRDGTQIPQWNVDTFPPALVCACSLDPKLSEDDVADMWATWEQPDLLALYFAARDVCERRRVVDLGKGWPTTTS